MDWKSTAILVQMTSRPMAGGIPRRGEDCGDRTSEAVGSAGARSLGTIAMRLRISREYWCGNSLPPDLRRKSNASHSSLRSGSSHLHLDSRIIFKEYKLIDCIGEFSRNFHPRA